jgi:outer membrane protein insertion porin family
LIPPRLRTAVLLVLCCLLLPAAAVSAQSADAYYGRTVTAVTFEVDGRPDTSTALVREVSVRVGQPLTREDVRASMDRLFALGRYEDIRPVAAETPLGVSVTFRLTARYPASRVVIEPGDTGVTPGALRTEIEQRFGGVPTGVRNETVADVARRFLNDEGYLDATVAAETVVDREVGSAALVLSVQAGTRTLIQKAEVSGRSPLDPDTVLKRAGARAGEPFRRRAIEAALSDLEEELRARGYYEAQATLLFQRASEAVDVNIRLDAGPRVEIRIEPDPGLLPGRLDEVIPIRRQQSADQDLLEDSQHAIEGRLQREGYADAAVSFTRELSPDGLVLVVTFRIDRGPRYYVERFDLPAGLALSPAELETLIKIRPGDVFDPERVTAGLEAVVDAYRARGYYKVSIEPTRETSQKSVPGQVWVVIHPTIEEGPRGEVGDLTFDFTGPHTVTEESLRASMRVKPGDPFVSYEVAVDQDTLLRRYRESGYLNAVVGIEPRISDDGRTVSLRVSVVEGEQVIVTRITVVGNQRISETRILEAIRGALDVGQPLGESSLSSARQRLAALGVFRRVSVVAEDRLSGETDARVVISVVEAPDTTVAFGAGVEGASLAVQTEDGTFDDRVELSPRGTFEIGRRNLGGKNRSINFYSRLSLRRKDREQPTTDEGFRFTEYRLTTTFREQRVFQTDTDLLVGLTSEQAIRTTYKFLRRSANAEALHRLDSRVSVSGRYALDFTRLFDERVDVNDQPLIDRLFPQVRLSYFSTGLTWDGRDSPLGATRGGLLSADVELSGRAIGSEVGYVKTFFQGSRFLRLTGTADTVLALRAQLGLARGFERSVTTVDPDGTSRTDVVSDLPISQRFFAGGSTSVRGFQVDRLGVYNPDCTGTACSVIDRMTGLSLGGNAMVVLNAELRRRVFKKISGAAFLDGGNVYAKAADLDLTRIRGAAGFGVRVDSPLGAIRLDFGFKLSRRTIAGTRESGWEYHLSFGEAF